ncbi:GNAT family N-acetyltransferase [Staphylococcus sp. NRL 16/872]|uniref:GNAT family N-acetyltransferase n=1 Tax=Staphylococcus sp. NRL 16/872 TaxID=2930131 RepID=UPI001FB214EE|nr:MULTISPECIES: GNAT family N-acetyltransferase [unclassified Staphylococcus]MCJ1656662.1 GNAT family N-acetyltransferase [Staphylococcus sp. NRL 21/187]MCJ1662417.1 GNAT family N-acetyltransferase [Staphylococcus sp. NRL 18/288]MCJ1668506.1 GNAT family N-acetyltransferase [Staphylococcus sp. NRL 19/737]WEN68723.1 GNAT family N-acetyltransferase [Staphylococcus sp. NRL 16/872]
MFEIVKNKEMLSACFAIRKEVFVKEQGVPLENELDSFEEESTHVLGFDQSHHPFACARFRPYEEAAKIERVAILKEYRKYGYGHSLMTAIERFAKAQGYHRLVLNAQTQAQGFYEKLDYTPIGEVFLEENIEHVKMYKNI